MVQLVGNWLICIPLVLVSAGLGLAFAQSGFPFGVVPCLVVIIWAIRTRSRLSDYQYFEEQWVRTAGGTAPPRKRMSLDNLLLVFAIGGVALAWAILTFPAQVLGALPPAVAQYLLEGTNLTGAIARLVLGVGVPSLLAVFSLLVWKLVRRARLAKRKRLAADRVLDGKPLPNDVVTVTLGVPRSSPTTANFTQALPDYCKPLLDETARRMEAAPEDEKDAITEAAPVAPPKDGGFLQTLWQWGQSPKKPPKWVQYAGGSAAIAALLLPGLTETGLVDGVLAYMPASWFSQQALDSFGARKLQKSAAGQAVPTPAPPVPPAVASRTPEAPRERIECAVVNVEKMTSRPCNSAEEAVQQAKQAAPGLTPPPVIHTSPQVVVVAPPPAVVQQVAPVTPRGCDDAECLYQTGYRLFLGEGVPKDKTEALRFFKRSAQKGGKWGQLSTDFLEYMQRNESPNQPPTQAIPSAQAPAVVQLQPTAVQPEPPSPGIRICFGEKRDPECPKE